MMPIPATSTDSAAIPQTLLDAYALLAWRAMLTEVNLSPKPGLVDRINCGAHKDAQLPSDDVLKGLRPLGMACEADMFRATAGVNTHKGSIFSLGLLCAAIGRLHQQHSPITPANICSTAATFCRGLTERELRQNNQQLTAGQRLYQQLGLTGARGEAEAGYPLVIRHALPHYRALLAQGRDPELALLDTLLLLISMNGDTNVASRGGAEGLRWIQQQATTLLRQGGIRSPADLEHLHRFDQQCIAHNLSPGGSADLLIVTWFLAQISQVNHLHNY